jgi:hypothetical protein
MVCPIISGKSYVGERGKSMKAMELAVFSRVVDDKPPLPLSRSAGVYLIKYVTRLSSLL